MQYLFLTTWCHPWAVIPLEMLAGGRSDSVRPCRNPPQGAGAGGAVQLQAVPLQEPLHHGLAHPPPQVRVLLLRAVSICGRCWSFSLALLWCSWASSDDVWISMLNKELKYFHDSSYLQRHPRLQPKMRAILLDWLLEVRAELRPPRP